MSQYFLREWFSTTWSILSTKSQSNPRGLFVEIEELIQNLHGNIKDLEVPKQFYERKLKLKDLGF